MIRSSEPSAPRIDDSRQIASAIDTIRPAASRLSSWFDAFAREHATRLAFDLGMLTSRIPRDCKIIEFGALPFILTHALTSRGYNVTPLDIAPERFSISTKLNVVKCNVETEQLPFVDGQFSTAVFNELFEHLRINIIFTLREVRRVLIPGGRLFLSTPNLRSLRGLYNFVFRQKSASCMTDIYPEWEKLDAIGHMGHVREYTSIEVATLLKRVGFRVDEICFRGRFESPLARLATQLRPRLRPFMTLIATAVPLPGDLCGALDRSASDVNPRSDPALPTLYEAAPVTDTVTDNKYKRLHKSELNA